MQKYSQNWTQGFIFDTKISDCANFSNFVLMLQRFSTKFYWFIFEISFFKKIVVKKKNSTTHSHV